MSDPVNIQRLTEAYDLFQTSMQTLPPSRETREQWETIGAVLRAALEAPTAEWCKVHGSKMVGFTGMCQAMRLDLLEDVAEFESCNFGRVRLVAEDA